MSWTNRVIWQEGMFLRTQHFQQQDRWTEQIIQSRDNQLSKMDREIQLYRSGFAGKLLLLAKELYRVVARDGRKYLVGYHPAVRYYREDMAEKVREDFALLKREVENL